MEKMAMDALDRGWALGFGTRARVMDADLEAARARAKEAEHPDVRPRRVPLGLLLLAAMGPMPRAAH